MRTFFAASALLTCGLSVWMLMRSAYYLDLNMKLAAWCGLLLAIFLTVMAFVWRPRRPPDQSRP